MNSTAMPRKCFPFSNDEIANILEQIGDLLEIQGANYYRVRAYREAAQTIRSLKSSVVEVFQNEGTTGLERLPHIGHRLSLSLEELIHTGELSLLNRLLEEVSPEDRFRTIPGIGPVLARRIYQDLKIETLEELELAAHTGKLDTVKGFGKGRIQLVGDALEAMLNRSSSQRIRVKRWQSTHALKRPGELQPPISLILDIDAQYRRLAKAGQLQTIAPRRFNPQGKRWLPVMHLKRDGWWFSALYSNTFRAHKLGKTHDWVIIYYEREGHTGQCTVVTETRGALRGKRVVRGQEIAA
ncbi:MAG: DNA-binding protein [Leptolyngbya sp. SIO1E4]|nr:DNA-binding protein [Leptolyngbya sp. SIO1E4]